MGGVELRLVRLNSSSEDKRSALEAIHRKSSAEAESFVDEVARGTVLVHPKEDEQPPISALQKKKSASHISKQITGIAAQTGRQEKSSNKEKAREGAKRRKTHVRRDVSRKLHGQRRT